MDKPIAPALDGEAPTSARIADALSGSLFGRAAPPNTRAEIVAAIENHDPAALRHWLDATLQAPAFRRRWTGVLAPDAFVHPAGDAGRLHLSMADPRSARFCGEGWSHIEPTGRWMTDGESTMLFGALDFTCDALLLVDLAPFFHPDNLPEQRLELLVNGAVVGHYSLGGGARRTLGCDIPRALIADRAGVSVVLRHPDGRRPVDVHADTRDGRHLSIFVFDVVLLEMSETHAQQRSALSAALAKPLARANRPATPRSPEADADLASKFESLGDDCEFGFVQRFLGTEPIALLRFTGIRLLHLVRGLRTRFQELASPDQFDVVPNRHKEFMGKDHAFKMEYHTEKYTTDTDRDTLRAAEMTRLKYLARKLLEDIEDGPKILVIKDKFGLPPSLVLSLHDALRHLGSSVLLWVDTADAEHPPGTVDLVAPGLLKGYIDRFATLAEGPHTVSLESWRTMMLNAVSLWASARPTEALASPAQVGA